MLQPPGPLEVGTGEVMVYRLVEDLLIVDVDRNRGSGMSYFASLVGGGGSMGGRGVRSAVPYNWCAVLGWNGRWGKCGWGFGYLVVFMVFGHEFKGCTKRPRTPEEEEDMKRKEEALSKLKNDNMDTSGEQDRWKKASFRQYNYKGLPDDNPVEINTLKDRMIIDQFLNKKTQPSVLEISNWSNDMIKCFKEKWEEDRKRDADNDMQKNESMESDEEDVITEVNGMKENVIANEIPGMGSNILH
ncbi:hypothetical protein Tco_0058005 [Tanacetum coccineum]